MNLTFARKRYSSEFSGGMKRRLCVAIALIGSPSVVLFGMPYLDSPGRRLIADEPTTGLDPASKHSLWDVILNYKPNAALLLTTHSMEEAEVFPVLLCRIELNSC